jgi:predicted DNA binding CopG/RHH family protein
VNPHVLTRVEAVGLTARKATQQYLGKELEDNEVDETGHEEKDILDSFERGEWRSVRGAKTREDRYARYARATFRKDRRLNIRISSRDLEAIQKRALEEGLPHPTVISSCFTSSHQDD